jgi:hypothetical protein
MTQTEFTQWLLDGAPRDHFEVMVDTLSDTDRLLTVDVDGVGYKVLQVEVNGERKYFYADDDDVLHRLIDKDGNVIPIWNNISELHMLHRLLTDPITETNYWEVYKHESHYVVYTIMNHNEHWILLLPKFTDGSVIEYNAYWTVCTAVNKVDASTPTAPIFTDEWVNDDPFALIVNNDTFGSETPKRLGRFGLDMYYKWIERANIEAGQLKASSSLTGLSNPLNAYSSHAADAKAKHLLDGASIDSTIDTYSTAVDDDSNDDADIDTGHEDDDMYCEPSEAIDAIFDATIKSAVDTVMAAVNTPRFNLAKQLRPVLDKAIHPDTHSNADSTAGTPLRTASDKTLCAPLSDADGSGNGDVTEGKGYVAMGTLDNTADVTCDSSSRSIDGSVLAGDDGLPVDSIIDGKGLVAVDTPAVPCDVTRYETGDGRSNGLEGSTDDIDETIRDIKAEVDTLYEENAMLQGKLDLFEQQFGYLLDSERLNRTIILEVRDDELYCLHNTEVFGKLYDIIAARSVARYRDEEEKFVIPNKQMKLFIEAKLLIDKQVEQYYLMKRLQRIKNVSGPALSKGEKETLNLMLMLNKQYVEAFKTNSRNTISFARTAYSCIIFAEDHLDEIKRIIEAMAETLAITITKK